MPIDFDDNWPEMNQRPTAAFLHGVSVAPHSLSLGLPRVVAFPLLLFDRSDSNSKAALFFFPEQRLLGSSGVPCQQSAVARVKAAHSKGNRQVRLPFYGFPMVILAQKAAFGTKLVAAGREPAGIPALT